MELSGYLINVAASFVAVEYMDHQFQPRYSGARRIVWFIFAWISYFMLVTGLNLAMGFEGPLLLLYGAAVIIYGVLALNGSMYEMVKAGLIWVLILMLSAYIIYGLFGIITEKPVADMVPLKGELLPVGAAAGCGLRFSMGRMVSAVFPKSGMTGKPEDWGTAGAFLLLLFLTLGLFGLETEGLGRTVRCSLTLIVLLLEFGVILTLESMQKKICQYRERQMEQEYRIREIKNHEEELMNLYRIGKEINHWRHDIIGELNVLHCMLRHGKTKEVEGYIEKINKTLKTYPELLQETGNEGLDAALIKAVPKCREKGIYFCYRVFGKPGVIDAMEMGRLMNNLLDNGIEACMKAEGERELELTIFSNPKEGTKIRLENTIQKSVLKNNPEMKSSKPDKELHGFGMQTIYEIVGRYSGEYVCREEDGRFVQRIFLPYKKQ